MIRNGAVKRLGKGNGESSCTLNRLGDLIIF
jgi:hypothetical protein